MQVVRVIKHTHIGHGRRANAFGHARLRVWRMLLIQLFGDVLQVFAGDRIHDVPFICCLKQNSIFRCEIKSA